MEFFATQYLIAYAVESSTNFLCKQLSEYESNWFKLIEFDWFKVYLPATDRMHVVISLSQQKAMSNEKRGIQKKSVRVFGVKFEADDPGSGTWDHVEETWEFTHEQVRSVDDFVDEHGYMNYKEKDGLKKFREQYKDCIK